MSFIKYIADENHYKEVLSLILEVLVTQHAGAIYQRQNNIL